MGLATKPTPAEENEALASPVQKVARSKIGVPVQLLLYAQSGGFCQFDGCEHSLTEHHLTKKSENAGEQAHIVAYSDGGPRSDVTLSHE